MLIANGFLYRQRTHFVVIGLLLLSHVVFCGVAARAQAPGAPFFTPPVPDSLSWIQQLSDDDFQTRQRAERYLIRQGVQVWDELYRACDSRDPQISSAAERILNQIPFETELVKQSPELYGFAGLAFSNRARMIIRLGNQPNDCAQNALAMIARFESDEVLSRSAAIELITGAWRPNSLLVDYLGSCDRVACRWIRVHIETASSIRDFVDRWQPVIDSLIDDPFIGQHPDGTRRLLQWYAEQLMSRGEDARANWTVQQIIDRMDHQVVDVVEMLDWLLLHRHYQACEAIIERFGEALSTDRRFVYRCAQLAREQGEWTRADEWVESLAANEDHGDELMRLQLAIHLQMSGLDHWARLELESIVSSDKVQKTVTVQAHCLLAEICYHELDFEQAATALQKAMQLSAGSTDVSVTLLNPDMQSRYHYFAHLAAEQQDDQVAAYDHLSKGLTEAPDSGDLLVALLRFATTSADRDEELYSTAMQLIDITLEKQEAKIAMLRSGFGKDARQSRLARESLTNELNSFAWLASRTGVRLERAEEYAREAVTLSPGNAAYLDTYASCLFAGAKLGEAVVWQQRAMQQAPWSQEIRSGMIRYRQAMMLAEMQGLFR